MFDFSQHMRRLCEDIVGRLPEFAHVDLSRVAITFAQARVAGRHGLQAKLTPLRFRDGQQTELRRGRRYRVEPVVLDGREMLYILTFYLPRFLNHSRQEKLSTVLHELYHVSPRCDGDIRRMPGRNYAHAHSRATYDSHMDRFVDAYLAACGPSADVLAFLDWRFEDLQSRFGGVSGLRVRAPRLLPVD